MFNFRPLEVSSFFQKVFDLRSDFYLHQENKWLQTIAITRFVKTDCSFLFVRAYIFDLYPVLCDYWCLQECDGSASVTEFTAGTYFSRIRDTPFATRHHESVPLCENTYRTVAKILDDLLCLYLNYDYYFLLLRAWDDSLDFRVGTIGDIYNTYITKYCIGIVLCG